MSVLYPDPHDAVRIARLARVAIAAPNRFPRQGAGLAIWRMVLSAAGVQGRQAAVLKAARLSYGRDSQALFQEGIEPERAAIFVPVIFGGFGLGIALTLSWFVFSVPVFQPTDAMAADSVRAPSAWNGLSAEWTSVKDAVQARAIDAVAATALDDFSDVPPGQFAESTAVLSPRRSGADAEARADRRRGRVPKGAPWQSVSYDFTTTGAGAAFLDGRLLEGDLSDGAVLDGAVLDEALTDGADPDEASLAEAVPPESAQPTAEGPKAGRQPPHGEARRRRIE